MAHIKRKKEMEMERELFPTHKCEHGQPPARRMKGVSLWETEYEGKYRPVAFPNMGPILSPCARVDAIIPDH